MNRRSPTRRLIIRAALAFALLGVLIAPEPVATAATAPGAIFTCNATGQYARVDPIVSEGTTSAHEHAFFGARGVETTETTADLRSKPTSCVETNNHTGYWMPSVYRNGVRLLPATSKHLLIYYRCKVSNCAQVPSLPDDFHLVAGNSGATTASANPVLDPDLGGWRCGTGGGQFAATPPATCSAKVLVAGVTFPSQNGLRIQMYFRWQLPSTDVGTITLGDIGASPITLHADYFFGWDRAAFENFMDRCIRASVACPTNVNV